MSTAPDVIVVGGGIAGVATTYYLARGGAQVTLLERDRPAAGASGRNPGFLWLQTKTGGPQMDLGRAGRRFTEELADELGDFGFRPCGGLVLIRDKRLLAAGEAFAADRRDAGLDVTMLDRQELRSMVPALSDEVIAGVWNPLDAHQDTARLVKVLVDAATHAGAEIRSGVRVDALETSGDRCTGVRTDDGTIASAEHVVLANGIDANGLLSPVGLDLPMTPVRYEALETDPSDARVDPVICGQSLFGHFDFIRDLVDEAGTLPPAPEPQFPELGFTEQIVQFGDGRFQLGCAVTADTTDDRPTLAGLGLAGTILARNVPALARLPVTRIWAGIVAQTPDYLPAIAAEHGMTGVGVNTAHAFGNLAGPLSGRLLSDALLGNRPGIDMSPFSPERFRT